MSLRLRFRFAILLVAAAALGAHAPRAAAHVHASGAVDPHWSDGYTLVVLDPGADLDAAREWIQERGATVALLLPPRYLTAWIDPALDAQIVGQAGIRALHRDGDGDGDAKLPAVIEAGDRRVQRFFARAARGELDRVDVVSAPGDAKPDDEDGGETPIWRPDALPRPPISELDIAANLSHQGITRKAGGASLAANSDYMTGTVSVTLFFVESDGSGSDQDVFDWDADAEDDVFDDVAAGLSWWVSQAKQYSGCWVTFRLQAHFATEDNRCSQWREPSLHSSTEYAQAVQQVLGNFGYTTGGHLARASAFNAAMRVQNHTDWAYSAFVAANPSGPRNFTDGYAAWAWMGGPYVSLLQRSFTWSIKQVFTHETAHMFRACDEYYTPGYGGCTECTACFDTGVANGNCEECNPNATTCMMRTNAYALCDYTAGQLGWWRSPCSDYPGPAPRLDSAAPTELAQGGEADIVLHGDFFSAGTQASFGAGITLLDSNVQSETQLQARIRVDVAANAGLRDIVVTGPDGREDRLPGGFRIRSTPRHYLATHGGNVYPYDRPERAATDFTAALAACSPGDTLLLAGGTYAPIALHQTLVLQGGWADDFGVRAVVANPTIVHAVAGTPAITIDGAANHPILDGLVLRGGVGAMVATPELGNIPAGGGILVVDASPTLRNCRLENNAAGASGSPSAGGGGFFWHGTPRLEGCVVTGNHAERGAGLFFLNADATLVGNTIATNDANGAGMGAGIAVLGGRLTLDGGLIQANTGAREGGGAHVEAATAATFAHVEFDANDATLRGGGIAALATPVELVACRITRNSAGERGGGVHVNGGSLEIESSLLAANHAGGLGGGLGVESCAGTLENVTIAANEGGPASGIFWNGAATPGALRGCILADNAQGGLWVASGTPPVLDWNLYWNNAGWDHPGATEGAHDVTSEPLFAAAATLDFQLAPESPALDSGDPAPTRLDPDGSPNDRGAYGGPRAAPAAPRRLDGMSAQALSNGHRIGWNPSPEAGIATYIVYRDVMNDFRPTAANRVATLAAPATTWLDPLPIPAAWYRVIAVDVQGHASGASSAVQPGLPSDASSERILAVAIRRIAPNPANPSAWIDYELPAASTARLAIFDSRGRRIRDLLQGARTPGAHRMHWDGHDDAGRLVASGVYWVRLSAGPHQSTAKLVILR